MATLPKIKIMQIHQLSVSYVDRQDRLMLRVNTASAQEFRFWLTRRMALRLLPAIEQSLGRLEAQTPGVLASDSGSRQVLTDLKREAFLEKADFHTPFAQQPAELPLGEAPMLVTDVQLTVQATGGMLLVLQDKGGTPEEGSTQCQLQLQAPLVHGLSHLMRQAMDTAQWETGTAASSPAEASPLETAPSGYRH